MHQYNQPRLAQDKNRIIACASKLSKCGENSANQSLLNLELQSVIAIYNATTVLEKNRLFMEKFVG